MRLILSFVLSCFVSHPRSQGWKKGDILTSNGHALIAGADGSGTVINCLHACGRDYARGNSSSLADFVQNTVQHQEAYTLNEVKHGAYTVWHFEGTDTGKDWSGAGSSGGDTTPYATKMKDKMKDELSKAKYKYESDTTLIAITEVKTGRSHFWLTHVIVSSPNQIVFGNVVEQTKTEYEKYWHDKIQVDGCIVTDTNSYLNSVKGLVAVNGGNFDITLNTHLPDTNNHGTGHAYVIIRNSEVYEGSEANGNEICLHKDGNISIAYTGEKADDLLKKGVKEIFASGEHRIISNTYRPGIKEGGTYGAFSDRYKDQEADDVKSGHDGYDNTIMAMVEPGNYYTLSPVNNSPTYWADVRNYLWDLGCTVVKSLDSGGSASLSFRKDNKGDAIVIEASDGREVPSFLYFREFKEGDPLLGGGTMDGSPNAGDKAPNLANKDPGKGDDKFIPEDDPRLLLTKDFITIADKQTEISLATRDQFTNDQLKKVDDTGQSIQEQKKFSIFTILKIVIFFIGLLLIVYGIILLVAYYFDRANLYVKGSLLNIITLGAIKHDESYDDADTKISTRNQVIISVCAIELMGMFLISGILFGWVNQVYLWIESLI